MKNFPLGFQSVKVIALAATDVVRAKRFYSETLQLEEDRETTDEVGYRIGIDGNWHHATMICYPQTTFQTSS